MPRYRALSIKERGGLDAHWTTLGFDPVIIRRMYSYGMNSVAIAEAIEAIWNRKFNRRTIANWRKELEREKDGTN